MKLPRCFRDLLACPSTGFGHHPHPTPTRQSFTPCTAPYPPLPVRHRTQVRIELYDRRQTRFISAHTNALSCLVLSMDGKRLATASDKGTLVRVWHTADGTLLQVGLHEGGEGIVVWPHGGEWGCCGGAARVGGVVF